MKKLIVGLLFFITIVSCSKEEDQASIVTGLSVKSFNLTANKDEILELSNGSEIRISDAADSGKLFAKLSECGSGSSYELQLKSGAEQWTEVASGTCQSGQLSLEYLITERYLSYDPSDLSVRLVQGSDEDVILSADNLDVSPHIHSVSLIRKYTYNINLKLNGDATAYEIFNPSPGTPTQVRINHNISFSLSRLAKSVTMRANAETPANYQTINSSITESGDYHKVTSWISAPGSISTSTAPHSDSFSFRYILPTNSSKMRDYNLKSYLLPNGPVNINASPGLKVRFSFDLPTDENYTFSIADSEFEGTFFSDAGTVTISTDLINTENLLCFKNQTIDEELCYEINIYLH